MVKDYKYYDKKKNRLFSSMLNLNLLQYFLW